MCFSILFAEIQTKLRIFKRSPWPLKTRGSFTPGAFPEQGVGKHFNNYFWMFMSEFLSEYQTSNLTSGIKKPAWHSIFSRLVFNFSVRF
jgi:hypothetical protein